MPYVKRGKTDAGDADAICEAVSCPGLPSKEWLFANFGKVGCRGDVGR